MVPRVEPNVQAIQPNANSAVFQPGPAIGISRPGSVNAVTDSQVSRADPIQRVSGALTSPAPTPPAAPRASSTPTQAGRRCTDRIRYRGPRVSTMITKKFAVPLQAAPARSTGSCQTYRRPGPIRVGGPPAGAVSPSGPPAGPPSGPTAGPGVAGSRVRMVARLTTETT